MKRTTVMAKVRLVQKSMSSPMFSELEVEDHVRVLVRLCVEFYYHSLPSRGRFLKTWYADIANYTRGMNLEEFDRQHFIQSTISALDSFQSLSMAYRVIKNRVSTMVDWDKISVPSLKNVYIELYREFLSELVIERKCRMLLDLFRLQIVYAGVYYDG